MRKKGGKNKNYSAEFKISVIMDMRENHLGYRETIRKYWHTGNCREEALYTKTLKLWERRYLEEGAEGLMTKSAETSCSNGQVKRRKREKSGVQTKVGHAFGIIKGPFRTRKTRYRKLMKRKTKMNILFALANRITEDRSYLATYSAYAEAQNSWGN